MTDYKKQKILTDVKKILEKQTMKGLKKYGTTVNPSALEATEWIDHACEEIVDTLVYLQSNKQKIRESMKNECRDNS